MNAAYRFAREFEAANGGRTPIISELVDFAIERCAQEADSSTGHTKSAVRSVGARIRALATTKGGE